MTLAFTGKKNDALIHSAATGVTLQRTAVSIGMTFPFRCDQNARWGGFSKDLPHKRKGGVILQRWGANAKVGSNRKEGGV